MEFSRTWISRIRPPTAAATCTTSASSEASLEDGCRPTQEADRSATTTATTMIASAISLPRETNRLSRSAIASPAQHHPGQQPHRDAHGCAHCELEGDYFAEGWSRQNQV